MLTRPSNPRKPCRASASSSGSGAAEAASAAIVLLGGAGSGTADRGSGAEPVLPSDLHDLTVGELREQIVGLHQQWRTASRKQVSKHARAVRYCKAVWRCMG